MLEICFATESSGVTVAVVLFCVDVGDLFCYREFGCDSGSCAVLC